jgi:hypothetical protein
MYFYQAINIDFNKSHFRDVDVLIAALIFKRSMKPETRRDDQS